MFWKELKNKPFCNDCHYFLIAVILLFVSIKLPYFFILLGLFLIFIYKKTKMFIPLIIVIFLVGMRYYFVTLSYNESSSNTLIGEVTEVNDNSFILKTNNGSYMLYTSKTLEIGDEIECSVNFYEFEDIPYENAFDYKDYLYSLGIKRYGKLNSYELIDKKFNLNIIKYNILSYYKNKLDSNTYDYVKALVFGENDLNDSLKEGYSMLGLSHILAISGMHIFLIYKFLSIIILKLFRIPNSNIPVFIIGLYTLILGFKASVLRAFLFLLIGKINNIGYIKYTKLDILSISFILIILVRPYMFYQSGFLLSFLVSFILIFMSDFVRTKSKIKKLYLNHIIIYFVTLPITISFYNEMSLLSIIVGPILSIILIYILLPLAFISCFVYIKYIGNIFNIINDYILGLVKFNYTLVLPSFNSIMMIVYYILLLYILIRLASNKKAYLQVMFLTIFFIVLLNLQALNPYNNVTFLSCGQGDSALVEFKHNKGNILIDAYNSYDYLKSKGIKKLDYLIITHSDSDHLGDLDLIINNLEVSNVIYPKYDNVLAKYELSYFVGVDSNYSFYFNSTKFEFLSPIIDMSDKNDNSLVLKFTLDRYEYLFCGDISTNTEDILLSNNKNISCDILKVAHHGSKTSSSSSFLAKANPKYAIISAKKDNKYNFPNEEVLKRLSYIAKIYITYECGNITFRVNKNKLEVLTFY